MEGGHTPCRYMGNMDAGMGKERRPEEGKNAFFFAEGYKVRVKCVEQKGGWGLRFWYLSISIFVEYDGR